MSGQRPDCTLYHSRRETSSRLANSATGAWVGGSSLTVNRPGFVCPRGLAITMLLAQHKLPAMCTRVTRGFLRSIYPYRQVGY